MIPFLVFNEINALNIAVEVGLVVGIIPYHYSTTVTLRELLDRKGVENDCITVFERHRMQ